MPLSTDDAIQAVRRGQYETLSVPLNPADILPLINSGAKRAEILGISVRVIGTRLGAFKRGLVCAGGCGRVGSRFYLERHRKRGPGQYGSGWHLNLYAVNPDGTETLMTRDHIVPRSKGGKDHPDNSQTMCRHCNHAKADKLPDTDGE